MQKKFGDVVESAIKIFEDNGLIKALNNGTLHRDHYIRLLIILFQQVKNGPSSFAMAGAYCADTNLDAKEYLIQHAEEEKTHWRWILDDLNALGVNTSTVIDMVPHPTALAYTGLNFQSAILFPLGRLAIAAVLEGISAHLGEKYLISVMEKLELSSKQITFFNSHAETDKVHINDIWSIIHGLKITEKDWGLMAAYATTAGYLYKSMYDAASHEN